MIQNITPLILKKSMLWSFVKVVLPFKKYLKILFIYLTVLSLHRDMGNLPPGPGIESGLPALGA